MSRPLNILILGGGIAGLALAAALRQRSAHRVVVLERGSLPGVPAALLASGLERGHSDVPDAQDYGIAIAPNGTRMLQLLDVADPVAALGGKPLQEISTRSAENEDAENMPYPLDPSAPAFFCRRSAMVRTLAHAAASPTLPGAAAQIHINVPVAELDIHAARYGTHSGDLLVLADGLSKAGRAAVVAAHRLPAELRDANTAQLAYMGLVPAKALTPFSHLHDGGVPRGCLTNWTWDPPHAAEEEEADEAAELARRGRAQQRLILYPLGDGPLQLFAYQPATPALLERFPRGGTHGSRAGFLRDVDVKEATQVFAAFAPEVQELLRSCPALDLAQIRDAPCLASWTAGRAVLVGDAAHATLPHTGQGSAQALEDAEALSYLLAPLYAEPVEGIEPASVPGLEEALAAFVAVRTPRAHMVQRTARMLNGCLAPDEAPHMRDWDEQSYMMSMLTYAGVEQQLAAQP